MVTAERVRAPRNFLSAWILANVVGLLLGVTCGAVVVAFSRPRMLASILGWAVMGFLLGAAQGLVIRKLGFRIRLWILASALGLLLSGPTAWGLNLPYLAVPLVGLLVGIFQWLILKRVVSTAEMWIVANVAAWALAYCVLHVSHRILGARQTLDAVTGVVVSGVLVGAITGIALSWLWQHTAPQTVGV